MRPNSPTPAFRAAFAAGAAWAQATTSRPDVEAAVQQAWEQHGATSIDPDRLRDLIEMAVDHRGGWDGVSDADLRDIQRSLLSDPALRLDILGAATVNASSHDALVAAIEAELTCITEAHDPAGDQRFDVIVDENCTEVSMTPRQLAEVIVRDVATAYSGVETAATVGEVDENDPSLHLTTGGDDRGRELAALRKAAHALDNADLDETISEYAADIATVTTHVDALAAPAETGPVTRWLDEQIKTAATEAGAATTVGESAAAMIRLSTLREVRRRLAATPQDQR